MNTTILSIRDALFDVAPFAVWVPVIVALAGFRTAPVYIRLLTVHLLFAGVVQAVAYYLWKNSQNNLPLLHLYTVEEMVMLTLFYSYILGDFIPRRTFLIIIGAFILCAVLNALFLQPLKTHNTYMRSLGCLVIIIWAIIYFYNRLAEENDDAPKKDNGLTWISAGLLVYFSASLLLFTLGNFMAGKAYREVSKSLWAIHALVSILLYIVIAIGLWKHRKTAT